MLEKENTLKWFCGARFGLFVHFGLYSMLGRGEWAMNREGILPKDYRKLADRFNPHKFDADAICALAVEAGMKYIVFTTMHHDGFRLYDTALSDFCSTRTAAKRDFTAEIMAAARNHGLKIGLYHSLNNWFDQPDAVDALENKGKYKIFMENTLNRIRELLEKYGPVEILWYDGGWPFNAKGWQADRMNKMVNSIQPQIIFPGRNGLPNDFATPEGHVSVPSPWRPWEACMTMNESWGFNKWDSNWKSVKTIIRMLTTVANGQGNLLLNIGPAGDGSIPRESVRILKRIGKWLKVNSEALTNTDKFDYDMYVRGNGRSEWSHQGVFTASGNNLYMLSIKWPGKEYSVAGLETMVKSVSILGDGKKYKFMQKNNVFSVSGLPEVPPDDECTVLKIECASPPVLYRTGGMRVPRVPHPHYDPWKSDIQK